MEDAFLEVTHILNVTQSKLKMGGATLAANILEILHSIIA